MLVRKRDEQISKVIGELESRHGSERKLGQAC